MDPTGFHANMNYSVRLSGLERPRNAVDNSTGTLRAIIKTVPQAIHHWTRTHTLGGIDSRSVPTQLRAGGMMWAWRPYVPAPS